MVKSYDCSQNCVTEVIVINVTLTAVKPFDYDLTTYLTPAVMTMTLT